MDDSVEVALLDSELNIPGLYLFHDFITVQEEEVFGSCDPFVPTWLFITLYCWVQFHHVLCVVWKFYVFATLVFLGASCGS